MGSLGDGVEGGSEKKKAMWLYPKVMGFNPSERWGHSVCYSQGFLYVFGGCCGGSHFGDVLRLNLDTMSWIALATTGDKPGPRDSHTAVTVSHNNTMIVFGGTNGSQKVNGLHVLDLRTNHWTQPHCTGSAPLPRESHTATLIAGSRLVVFGGSGEGEGYYMNDLHVLDVDTMTWTSPEVKGDVPVPRDSHSAVSIGNRVFVYGGDCGDRYNGDVDVLDMDTLTWSKLCVQGSSPGVRAGHAAVSFGTKVYVIGGVGDKQYYNDVWVLDVTTCSWTRLDVGGQHPQGRFSHSAIVTELDIAIYGGCGEDERPLNELLVLQLGAEHRNGRYNISMCKTFGKHWNKKDKRRPSKERNNDNMINAERDGEPESELRQLMSLCLDTLHPKRRRTSTSAKAWDVESEQEEHSLSLSQSSSPSLSDQEPTTTRRASNSSSATQGFNLFKKLSDDAPITRKDSVNIVDVGRRSPSVHMVRNGMPFSAVEQKLLDAGPIHSVIGTEVRGKVDGAFDSGYLMTATVNGKVFRGVLFSPGLGPIPRGPILAQNPPMAQPFPSHVEQQVRLFHQPMKNVDPRPVHSFSQGHHHTAVSARPLSAIRSSPTPRLRTDLQGVVLTLGGPGTSQR